MSEVRVLPAGPRALLVECADLGEALGLHRRWWEQDRPTGLVDAVPGARTVLLVVEGAQHLEALRSRVHADLRELPGAVATDRVGSSRGDAEEAAEPTVVEVPVHYDGPDLEDVAGHTGLRPEDVVRLHTGTPWTVGFGGFAPGFAYLADGDPRLVVPRRPDPRTRVPAGSVGLAGAFSGIYPRSSPGGWQLIGHTDLVLWDPTADPPALLRPGTRVRFVDAAGGTGGVHPGRVHRPPAADRSPATAASGHEGGPTAFLEVLRPGPLTLVQDTGRPGRAGIGVGPSGAADRGSHALGARLLGQDASAASLEVHAGGLEVRAHGGVTMVITGAPAPASVDGVPVGHAAPFHLPDGGVLRLAAPTRGLRTYVSVRGGIDVPEVLGSRSTDTLSGLGPRPLRAGEVLPVGRAAGWPTLDVAPVPPLGDGPLALDLRPGPRLDWLAHPDALVRTLWSVGADSDRVGVRLSGPALRRPDALAGRELESEGVVRGGVQVPPDGEPVVFLADHPVTGGYPVVAVLTDPALDLLAQAVPGQQVRLRWSRP